MISHLITGGCSFSAGGDTHSWTGGLTKFFKEKNPNLETYHTANISQGQPLIQKKVIYQAVNLINKGIDPNNIFIAVMWSGTSRSAWYIDNSHIISEMIDKWGKFMGGLAGQFVQLNDLTNKAHTDFFTTGNKKRVSYNPNGGWYFTVDGSDCPTPFIKNYYLLDQFPNGIGKVHSSLEHMIMLQNFCKANGIKLVQQFFMDSVYQDIIKIKTDANIEYLYSQLNHDTIITQGQFEYALKLLSKENNCELSTFKFQHLSDVEKRNLQKSNRYFMEDEFHPNLELNNIWVREVLLPFIESKILI